MMERQPLVYSKTHDVVGVMTKMDYKYRSVSFETEDGKEHVVALDDTIVMHSFGEDPDGTPLYDGDVFESHVSGSLYEAELVGGFLQFHLLNDDLVRMHEVDKYEVEKFLNMLEEANTYEILGNKYELEPEEEEIDFSFNVKIVKKFLKNGNKVYYYACNNKHVEQVDFIKVVFVGSALLKEEIYDRVTVSYDDFGAYMSDSKFTEASPSELQSYAMEHAYKPIPASNFEFDDCDGNCDCDCPVDEPIVYGDSPEPTEAPKDYSESEEEEPYCNECDRPVHKCECELWKKGRK